MVQETPILYHFINVLFISSEVRNLRRTERKRGDGKDKEMGKIVRNSPMCLSCGQVLTRHTVVWVKGAYIYVYYMG